MIDSIRYQRKTKEKGLSAIEPGRDAIVSEVEVVLDISSFVFIQGGNLSSGLARVGRGKER